MKKITALALTSAMVLSLAACGGSSSDTKTSDDSKKASKSDVEYVQDKRHCVPEMHILSI